MFQFHDACFAGHTPFCFEEASTRLPQNFPAFIGCGRVALGLDASGLMGLNHGVQSAFALDPAMSDLYVIRHGMVSDKISPMNAHPLGYLSWEMTLDGQRITPETLDGHASNWARRVRIDEGRVETEMVLSDRLKLELAVWMPHRRQLVAVEVTLTGYDHSAQPVDAPRQVALELIWQHRLRRRAETVYDQARFDGRSLTLSADGHHRYEWQLTPLGAPARFEEGALILPLNCAVGDEPVRWQAVFNLDGERVAPEQLPGLRAENLRAWQAYYQAMARVEGAAPAEQFLYNNSLFLTRALYDPALGYPIGSPFSFPPYWHDGVFWDSTFVMDGLMRAGDRAAADQFLEFLFRAQRPGPKPFVWMCLYDGTPALEEARDMAPLVLAAHATTAIRYHEYYRDEARLRERVFPLVKRVALYAIERLFARVEGAWELSTPVSHDVCEAEAFEVNHTYTHVWFLSVMDKYREYALALGETPDPRVTDALQHHRVELRDGQYDHCRGVRPSDAKDASWVPFLLYPTEAMPFVDPEAFEATRRESCFIGLYHRKQGCFQPWTAMLQAMSDWKRNDPEWGRWDYEQALDAVWGPGYFSEIGPHQQTGGLPAYITAHGAFLAAFLSQFVSCGIRERQLGLFCNLAGRLREGAYRVEGVQVADGLRVDARYSPGQLSAQLSAPAPGPVSVTCALPSALRFDTARVTVDGAPVAFERQEVQRDGRRDVRFTLPAGARRIDVG